MRVVIAITHTNEPTVAVCFRLFQKALEVSNINPAAIRIIAGKRPYSASVEAAIRIAKSHDADILIHSASDVFVTDRALTRLLSAFDLGTHWGVFAKGYDVIMGPSSGGLWALNMRTLPPKIRFRDKFLGDMDFATRMEIATGQTRAFTKDLLTYHHPIWTAAELFGKYYYSYNKYSARRQLDMLRFLTQGLSSTPTDRVLLSGKAGLESAIRCPPSGSKDRRDVEDLFLKETKNLGLSGKEYFIKHAHFRPLARALLDSDYECAGEAMSSEVPKINWK
jgi:hypothetical protein